MPCGRFGMLIPSVSANSSTIIRFDAFRKVFGVSSRMHGISTKIQCTEGFLIKHNLGGCVATWHSTNVSLALIVHGLTL